MFGQSLLNSFAVERRRICVVCVVDARRRCEASVTGSRDALRAEVGGDKSSGSLQSVAEEEWHWSRRRCSEEVAEVEFNDQRLNYLPKQQNRENTLEGQLNGGIGGCIFG